LGVAAPHFENFQLTESVHTSGKVHLTDAKSREYASALRNAARQKSNFAGHYILASWGCGASCIMAATVDAKTGAVSWLPFTVCCWSEEIKETLEFRTNSRLLVVHGNRDEKGQGDDTNYYEFTGGQFSHLDVP
jgi:hypothetical protein